MSNYITQQLYNSLIEAKNNNTYANHICNTKCKLGMTKVFYIKETNINITMKCTQIGGTWSGKYVFVAI